jgi:hypothetical protein
MKCMVIETFKPGNTNEVYERFKRKGRLLPTGLKYIDSWLSIDRTKCFQLMDTEKFDLFDKWISNWNDLTDFEIIPVENSPTKTTPKGDATEEG